MREFITGAVFRHHKRMKDTFIKSRIVRGSSAKIEQSMRTSDWDPLNPSAAVAVYVAEKTGKINSTKLVLAGTLENFKIARFLETIGPIAVRALPMVAGTNESGHYFRYFGPSGVRALPVAAGTNEGGHYFW